MKDEAMMTILIVSGIAISVIWVLYAARGFLSHRSEYEYTNEGGLGAPGAKIRKISTSQWDAVVIVPASLLSSATVIEAGGWSPTIIVYEDAHELSETIRRAMEDRDRRMVVKRGVA